MADTPQGIAFNEDERRLFLFLMGMEPSEAVPQDVFALGDPFATLDHDLGTLPAHYSETATKIDGALPDEAVTQFKGMFADLTGASGGINHIEEIRNAARLMAEQVENWGRSLGQAQVQILATLIALEIQLDIMAAMAFFTGGASLGEEAVAQAEARLTLMMIMQRLLALLEFIMPTLIQAAIGALIMMAASLVANALGDGDPHKPGINWEWVGAGALGGALADVGIRGVGGIFDKMIGDGLKGLENKYITELTNIGGDFLKMGAGSAIASTFTEGLLHGDWKFSPMMFVGAGIGGAAMGAGVRGIGRGGAKYRMMKIDPGTFRTLTNEDPLTISGNGRNGDGPGDRDLLPDPETPRPLETVAPPPVRQPPPRVSPPGGHPTSQPVLSSVTQRSGTLEDGPVTDPVLEDPPLPPGTRTPPASFSGSTVRENVPPPLDGFTEVPPALEETGSPVVQPPPPQPLRTAPLPPPRPGEALPNPAFRTGTSLTETPAVRPEVTRDLPPPENETPVTGENAPPRSSPRTTSSEPPTTSETSPRNPSGTTPAPPERSTPPEPVRTESGTDPFHPGETAPVTPHDTTSGDTPPDLVSRDDTTPNFVFDTVDHATQERLRIGQDEQVRRYTGRLENEDRRYWQQQEADQHVEGAITAHTAEGPGRPWTGGVRERFDARWQQEFDRHLDGELTRQEFEQRFQDLVDGLPAELELEAAVHAAQASAAEAFDAAHPASRFTPAAEVRLRARFLTEVESDVRHVAEGLGMKGEPVDPGVRDRFTTETDTRVTELTRGLYARMELDHEANLHFNRLLDQAGLDHASADARALRADYDAEFAARTRTLPDGRETRTLAREEWTRHTGELDEALRDLDERWTSRLGAKATENALLTHADDEVTAREILWRDVSERSPAQIEAVDRRAVMEEHDAELRREAARILGDRNPAELTASDWNEYAARLTSAHEGLVARLSARFDEHAGRTATLRRVDRALEETGRPGEHVERVRTDVRAALTEAHRAAFGRPDGEVWSRAELDRRAAAFERDHLRPYLASLADRLRFEESLDRTLGEGAGRFHELTGEASELTGRARRRYAMSETTLAEVAKDFRADWATLFHDTHGLTGRDIPAALEREQAHGDVFGTSLRDTWTEFQARVDAPRLARLRERAEVEQGEWERQLADEFGHLFRRTETLTSFDEGFEAGHPEFVSFGARDEYAAGRRDLRRSFAAELDRARSEEEYTAALDTARESLSALRVRTLGRDDAFRTWRDSPEWALDPAREHEPVVPEPPRPMRTVSDGPPPRDPADRRAYVEEVPDEEAPPPSTIETAATVEEPLAETVPPPDTAESRLREGLAGLRAEIELRDQAYVLFDRRLAAHPDRDASGSFDLVPLREWFADRWTADPGGRAELGREFARRLEEARALAEAGATFDREVTSAAPETSGDGFRRSPRVAALRERLVRALTGSALEDGERTRLVEEVRQEYARARTEWREQAAANRAFEAALTVEGPGGRLDLGRSPHDWDDATRYWYEEELGRLRTRYAGERAAAGDLAAPEEARLTEGVRQEAMRLSAEARPVAELGRRLETISAEHAPGEDWAPEVRSWYETERTALAEEAVGLVRGRRLDAELRARVESDHARQLAALREYAHARDLAERDFARLTADEDLAQAPARSPDTATWASRRVQELRDAYVEEHLTDAAIREHGGEFAPAPAHAAPGGWRGHAWRSAQTRVHGTYEELFTAHDAEIAEVTEIADLSVSAADREAFEEIFAAWTPDDLRETAGPTLVEIRKQAWEAFERRILTGDADRQGILDALPGELDLEAARQVALRYGRDAFDRSFDAWRHRMAEPDRTSPLGLSVTDAVREGERADFEHRWETVVRDIFTGSADIHAGLAPNMRAAATRLRELTGGLWDAFDRRAGFESEQERFAEAFADTAESVSGRLSEADRALLEAFGAQDVTVSEPGRREVLTQSLGELDTTFTELFPPGAEITEEGVARWRERFDETVAALPSRLAAQAAREAVLRRTLDDAGTAFDAWAAGPGLGEEFRERFGIGIGAEPPRGLRRSMEAALARSVNDRFGERFTGRPEGGLTERLEEWRTWYDEATGTDRLQVWLAVETARPYVSGTAERTFAEQSARWREEHPEYPLAEEDLARARTGLVERMLAAYDDVFGAAAGHPDELTGRTRVWDERVEGLTAELPAHLAFEATAPPALKGAGRSFHTLSARHRQDDAEWVDRTAESFHDDWFEEYRVLWAPRDLSSSWSEEESATTGAFASGRAEAAQAAEPAETVPERVDTETTTDVIEPDVPEGARFAPPTDVLDAPLTPAGTVVPGPPGGLGHGVVSHAPSGALPDAEVVARLLAMAPDERAMAFQTLPDAERAALARDPGFVGTLRRTSAGSREFASTAAQLLIDVPEGVQQPATVRERMKVILARMLVNPGIAERLLLSGSRVQVLPRDQVLTSVPLFSGYAGDGRSHLVRGRTDLNARVTVIAEENILGEDPEVPGVFAHADGYSVLTHEVSHLIWGHVLTPGQRRQITDWFAVKQDLQRLGHTVEWPDGPFTNPHHPDPRMRTAPNYSATMAEEFFAQAVNVYLGTNTGHDGSTFLPRNNDIRYLWHRERPVFLLLKDVFSSDFTRVEDANPLMATRADNAVYGAFRDFWNGMDGWSPAPAPAAPGHGPLAETSHAPGGLNAPPALHEPGVTDGAGFGRLLSDGPGHGAMPASEVAARLARIPPSARASELEVLTDAERTALARDPGFVGELRTALPDREFASVAAQLMVEVPEHAAHPVPARRRLHTILTRTLTDPAVAERLLLRGVRVLVLPAPHPAAGVRETPPADHASVTQEVASHLGDLARADHQWQQVFDWFEQSPRSGELEWRSEARETTSGSVVGIREFLDQIADASPRDGGPDRVWVHEDELVPILKEIFGRHESARTDEEIYEAFQDFWDGVTEPATSSSPALDLTRRLRQPTVSAEMEDTSGSVRSSDGRLVGTHFSTAGTRPPAATIATFRLVTQVPVTRSAGKGTGGSPRTIADLTPDEPTAGGGAPAPRRTGRGTGGDPMTIHDPPTPDRWPPPRHPFERAGEKLGAGDGKGTGIPGLSNEIRAESWAKRAELKPPKVKRPALRPSPKIITIRAVDDESPGRGGNSGSSGGPLQIRSMDGTLTLLEPPSRPTTESRTTTETTTEPTVEPTVEPTTTESTTEPTAETHNEPLVEATTEPPVTEKPVTEKSVTAPVSEGDHGTAPPLTEERPPPPAPVRRQRPAETIREARTALDALPEDRRTQAMRDANVLLRHLVGRAPSDEGGGLLATPLGRARVLVAAEVARSGRAAGYGVAERLARDPALRDPATGRGLPVLRLRPEASVGGAQAALRRLPEERRARAMSEADALLGDLVGRAPSAEEGGRLATPLGKARVLVAAE
ncbi:MAG: hypothetical protein ACRDP6_50225, partial [Actinoallomurus sp.]